MQTFLHGRNLIGDLDFTREEVETVLDVAFDLKRKRALNEPHPYLRDKVLAMLFFFPSTRTRGWTVPLSSRKALRMCLLRLWATKQCTSHSRQPMQNFSSA